MLPLIAIAAVLKEPANAQQAGPTFPRIADCYGIRLAPDSTDADIDEIAPMATC